MELKKYENNMINLSKVKTLIQRVFFKEIERKYLNNEISLDRHFIVETLKASRRGI